MHNLWLLTLRGELGLSPKAMEGAKRVLDAGTGTGIWAIEYGKSQNFIFVIGDGLYSLTTRPQPTCIRNPR